MIKREYHCLVAGLPALFFDTSRLASTLIEWKAQLKEDLHPFDYQLIELFFLRYDNRNIHNMLTGKPDGWNPLGNYTKEQVEEVMQLLKDEDTDPESLDFPVYLSRFIRAFKADAPLFADKTWENQLAGLYYDHLAATANPFFSDWYAYELDLTNIITALSCRKHQVEVRNQLVGENEIAEKLMRSNARDFGISNEFPLLDAILRAGDEEDLLERERKYDLVKWKYLDDKVFFHYFTIEIIFVFVVKLEMISRWLKLDKNTGERLFRDLIGQMESTYQFPEEFTI
jgi:vacuolar-type H+-ATPase subunit C/Vma6